MDDILALATKLGKAISQSDRFNALAETEEAAAKDDDAKRITKELEEHTRLIQEKERNQQPVEVEDKRKLEKVQEEIRSNETMQKLIRAQADYSELMMNVQRCIQAELLGE